MIEKLLANPYVGDGTLHPDMHLIYVDEVCGLFMLRGLPGYEVKKKVFPLSLKGKVITHKYRGSQQFSRVEYSTQIY